MPASPIEPARTLVRLGDLAFADFVSLDAGTVRAVLDRPESRTLLPVALGNRPRILDHLIRSAPRESGWLIDAVIAGPAVTRVPPGRARRALVEMFAFELLRSKAPALYEVLPWHDWDFGEVARRFPLWRTRFLLVGDSSCVTMAHCRRTAGVFVVEPLASMRAYLKRKAALIGLRRFELVAGDMGCIPLADRSVELAIAATDPSRVSGASLAEMERVARAVLVVSTRPGRLLDERTVHSRSLVPGSLPVVPTGGCIECWWSVAGGHP